MVDEQQQKKKKKKRRGLTAQCFGIILVVFALGMFIGYACNYQDVLANFFTGNNIDRTHVIHNSSEMAEHGARVGYYVLGTTENDNYSIKFNDKPQQEIKNFYTVEGMFTNNSGQHFTTVELNFSLLDKNGNKVGDIFAYCDGLNADQTWSFKAVNSKIIEPNSPVISATLDNVIYTFS